eukprot:5430800-Pleurochrysis_carterae.AAC.3
MGFGGAVSPADAPSAGIGAMRTRFVSLALAGEKVTCLVLLSGDAGSLKQQSASASACVSSLFPTWDEIASRSMQIHASRSCKRSPAQHSDACMQLHVLSPCVPRSSSFNHSSYATASARRYLVFWLPTSLGARYAPSRQPQRRRRLRRPGHPNKQISASAPKSAVREPSRHSRNEVVQQARRRINQSLSLKLSVVRQSLERMKC